MKKIDKLYWKENRLVGNGMYGGSAIVETQIEILARQINQLTNIVNKLVDFNENLDEYLYRHLEDRDN